MLALSAKISVTVRVFKIIITSQIDMVAIRTVFYLIFLNVTSMKYISIIWGFWESKEVTAKGGGVLHCSTVVTKITSYKGFLNGQVCCAKIILIENTISCLS